MPAGGPPCYDHLDRITDDVGLFEHCLGRTPRREHGYCVDDAARGLLVTVREGDQTDQLRRITATVLSFVIGAVEPDGRCHNRMTTPGAWDDEADVGDWWGRAVWGLGTAAALAETPLARKRALRTFELAALRRSPDLRAMCFAALGCGEVLLRGESRRARLLLSDATAMVPDLGEAAWRWPEPRLRYSNGSVAEALILGGTVLEDEAMTERGLDMLSFLLDVESSGDHLSVTGTGGRGPGEAGPLFDQQPIEVAAIADACARAHDVTGDGTWLRGVRLCWDWFTGLNDSGTAMVEASTGAGYDGLEPDGRNENCGAESTLAALSCYQQARRLAQLGVPA